jgi:hypothetical protein
MRYIYVGLLVTLGTASPLAAQDFKRFGFMVGCWQAPSGKDQVVQECWTPLAENMMLGMARYLTKDKATSYEFTAVEKSDSGVTWVSMPKGQPPDTFRLTLLADEVMTVSRDGDEFPGTIMYRRTSDGNLIVRFEAPPGVQQESVEIRMTRIKLPAAAVERPVR